MPGGAPGFALPADVDEPDPDDELQAQFDAEDDAAEGGGDDDGGGVVDAGLHAAGEPPLELGVDEFDDFEILAEADADDEDSARLARRARCLAAPPPPRPTPHRRAPPERARLRVAARPRR